MELEEMDAKAILSHGGVDFNILASMYFVA